LDSSRLICRRQDGAAFFEDLPEARFQCMILTMEVVLTIPEELGRALAPTPEVLRRRVSLDLAVSYYSQGQISLGKAAEMSGLKRGEFEAVLAERQASRTYSRDDLADDLASVRGDK